MNHITLTFLRWPPWPKERLVPQPGNSQRLLTTSTMPGSACWAQNFPFLPGPFLPSPAALSPSGLGWPNVGRLKQVSNSQLLVETSTMPSWAWGLQNWTWDREHGLEGGGMGEVVWE